MNKILSPKVSFHNEVINKKKLQHLMSLTFYNYGVTKSALIADRIKNLTFHYATMSGISLSVEDLRVPIKKRNLIGMTNDEVGFTEENYQSGNITTVERFQKVIDIWNNANNSLKDDVLTYFRESDPLNPLYIMAFSGARGNISQVRQLVGMRGLMADPQGQIIDLPIKSNFREGLKVTEYIISSYGARKGLVDTALRTADSGYLTRRLVDVAQDIIVREEDCLTTEGLFFDELFTLYKTNSTFKERLIGRLLFKELNFKSGDQVFNFPKNQEIDNSLATLLEKSSVKDFEVRSPLTCHAFRSICRKCYGWHLSYSKIVDLGEAVGILAAQSIGEPGTQLTMRTFHTGGVFSGDLTKQIRSPFAGTVNYQISSVNTVVRTIHGEKGFQLNEKVTLTLVNEKNTSCSFNLSKGALLLVNNNQQVYPNQVIAEIKKDANLILEEERCDIFTGIAGQVFLQNIKVEETLDGDNITKKSITTGLVWVLQGERLLLPPSARVNIGLGQKFIRNDTLAIQKIINKYPGIVSIDENNGQTCFQIVNASMILENGQIFESVDQKDTLEISAKNTLHKFDLHIKNHDHLQHGQTLASLKNEGYTTETGGVLYYSTSSSKNKKGRKSKKLFTGFLYWVPEATYALTSLQFDTLPFKDGNYIKEGTLLYSNVVAVSGYVNLDKDNSEVIIKPGELYQLSDSNCLFDTTNRFVEEGELLFAEQTTILVQKLSYLEFLNIDDSLYVLVRPVTIYKIPHNKGFFMEHLLFPSSGKPEIALRTIKRIFYKNGERVKANQSGVDLLKTFLILEIKNPIPDLKAIVNYLPSTKPGNGGEFKLKISLVETLSIKEGEPTKNKIKYLVTNNQFVCANTVLANIKILSPSDGTLVGLEKTNTNSVALILKETEIKTCFYNEVEKLLVKQGDLVRVGTLLTNQTRSKYSGQIYRIANGQIQLRLGRPYLVSKGTILRADLNSIVEKFDLLATLVYDKLKTVDIVQGLPKVEEILEARKIKNGCLLAPHEGKAFKKENVIEILTPEGSVVTIDINPTTTVNFKNGQTVAFLEQLTDGPISPHAKLEILFNYFQLSYSTITACRKSFKRLQLFLVNEVQRTYFSQGVQIADKHVELIVKQMTSKVRVYSSGDTTLLPGEILDINQAEMIAKATISSGEEPPKYRPLLLGLTKASLNSDSFISAASFQETTRVLTEAAIEGKKDWLNGLKENVIIGRLIPSGTGFNCFENLKKTDKGKFTNLLISTKQSEATRSFVLKARTN